MSWVVVDLIFQRDIFATDSLDEARKKFYQAVDFTEEKAVVVGLYSCAGSLRTLSSIAGNSFACDLYCI